MIKLAVYLLSFILVTLGVQALVSALHISGRIRMLLACLASLIPIAGGVVLFQSAGLHLSDLQTFVEEGSADIHHLIDNMEHSQRLLQELRHSQPQP